VGVARIAIDTSMLTTLIWIETVHAFQIRALYFIDYCLWKHFNELSLGIVEQSLFTFLLCRQVVEILDNLCFEEAVIGVLLSAATPDVYLVIFVRHKSIFPINIAITK
jgi:hypothetical protein